MPQAMLDLVLLVSLVQLPPDPAALPPRLPLVIEIDPLPSAQRSPGQLYRRFLGLPDAERQRVFEQLKPSDRATIVRQHVLAILDTFPLTAAERSALDAVERAATTSAFAGDPAARKRLENSEKELARVLPAGLLATYRSLLTPAKKGQDYPSPSR